MDNQEDDINSYDGDWGIKEIFFKSGLYKWLQVQDPESFSVLVQETIANHARKIKLENCLNDKEGQAKELYSKIEKAIVISSSKGSKLRPWEKNENVRVMFFWNPITLNLYWANICFDWFLKIGLILVPLLAIFNIFDIPISAPQSKPLPLLFALFSSTALVWLTSAGIVNVIISLSRIHSLNTWAKIYILGALSVTIWIMESLIGFALIPSIVDQQMFSSTGKRLGELEKVELLLGAAVYAFINILFAISKGLSYCCSLKYKVQYMRAKAVVDNLMERYNHTLNEIAALQEKINQIDKKLELKYDKERMTRKLQEISNNNTLGLKFTGAYPGSSITDISHKDPE
jgi:hypothetical protein